MAVVGIITIVSGGRGGVAVGREGTVKGTVLGRGAGGTTVWGSHVVSLRRRARRPSFDAWEEASVPRRVSVPRRERSRSAEREMRKTSR